MTAEVHDIRLAQIMRDSTRTQIHIRVQSWIITLGALIVLGLIGWKAWQLCHTS